jgi:hypothetical protein
MNSVAVAIPTPSGLAGRLPSCGSCSWLSKDGAAEDDLGWLPEPDGAMELEASPPSLASIGVGELGAFGMALLPRLPTLPTATSNGGDCFVVAASDGRELSFPVPPPGIGEEESRRPIAEGFGLNHLAFVLRHEQGWVSCASAATAGARFIIELPNSFIRDAWSGGPAQLAWAMQPPSGGCEWLTISVNQGGGVSPARHVFDPPPAIVLNGAISSRNAAALLDGAVWKLWTPCWDDCTESCLHTGPATASTDAAGRPVLSWSSMGITEISSKVRPPPGGACFNNAQRADGWFHLSVELPTGERLLLRDHENHAARLVVKHQRCENTGGWRKQALGPYADHSQCRYRGCHFDASTGTQLCQVATAP